MSTCILNTPVKIPRILVTKQRIHVWLAMDSATMDTAPLRAIITVSHQPRAAYRLTYTREAVFISRVCVYVYTHL